MNCAAQKRNCVWRKKKVFTHASKLIHCLELNTNIITRISWLVTLCWLSQRLLQPRLISLDHDYWLKAAMSCDSYAIRRSGVLQGLIFFFRRTQNTSTSLRYFCKQTKTAATVVEWPELSNSPWDSRTNSTIANILLSQANESVEKQTELVEMRISENFHTNSKWSKNLCPRDKID